MEIHHFNMRDPEGRAMLAAAIRDGVGPAGVHVGYMGGRGGIYTTEEDAIRQEGTEALVGGPCLYTWASDGPYADWAVRI